VSESSPNAQPRQRRWRPPGPPDNEVPHSAPLHAVLGRGPDAALFLVGAQAYSTGVVLSAALRLCRRFDSYNMHMELTGMPARNAGAADPNKRLMLGVQFADGRRAVMTTGFRAATPVGDSGTAGAVSLVSIPAGSIGELSFDVRYWLTSLPPAGRLLFITRWPALGIEETVTEVDGSAVAVAGGLATVLWPPVRPEISGPPPSVPPPATGWFTTGQ